MFGRLVGLVAATTILGASVAAAQERPGAERVEQARRSRNPAVRAAAERVDPEGHYPVRWDEHWTAVHWAEYPLVFAMLTFPRWGSLFITSRDEASFRGGIIIDDPVRDLVRLRSEEDRDAADAVSDVLWPLTQHYSLIDIFFVVPVLHDQQELAWRMFWIQAEAKGLAAVITWPTARLAGRERPIGSDCDRDPDYSVDCNRSNRFRSFYSGHVAMTVTGAGLTCANHENMNIYGGGWADRIPCLTSVASAAVVSVLRLMSDKHYFTDVFTGAMIGFAAGYLWPSLVRYSGEEGPADPQYDHPGDDDRASRPPIRAAVVPWGTPEGIGVGVVGIVD